MHVSFQRILFIGIFAIGIACSLSAPVPGGSSETAAHPTSFPQATEKSAVTQALPTLQQATGPNSIPATFFSMNMTDEEDYPKVTFGTLSHPAIGTWAWVEQTQGKLDFSKFDTKISAAVAHGLVDATTNTAEVSITLGMTPPWAAADPKSCKTTGSITWCTSGPSHMEDWSKFVRAALDHYNGKTMPHVRYYELWNEMNIDSFFTGTQADMLAMAKSAYPIIHSDPHSILLTPSVAGELVDLTKKDGGAATMADYLEAGGADYADGGTFHGYVERKNAPYPMPEDETESIIVKVESMRKVFDKHGLSGKPMCNTEGGWGNNQEKTMEPDWQAAFLARWYLLQAGLHAKDNIRFAAWFTWGKRFGWGTIESQDGEPTLAGIAYSQVYDWLVGSVISQPCDSDPQGTWTCSLTRPGGYRGLAVWNTQGASTFSPKDAEYTDYRDLAGNIEKVKKGSLIPIGIKPILLESMSKP
jgi:polysaccharide biosynthesis protein PslG